MDDYDVRRLSAYQNRTLEIASDDVRHLVAADPELADDDIRKLTKAVSDENEKAVSGG